MVIHPYNYGIINVLDTWSHCDKPNKKQLWTGRESAQTDGQSDSK